MKSYWERRKEEQQNLKSVVLEVQKLSYFAVRDKYGTFRGFVVASCKKEAKIEAKELEPSYRVFGCPLKLQIKEH